MKTETGRKVICWARTHWIDSVVVVLFLIGLGLLPYFWHDLPRLQALTAFLGFTATLVLLIATWRYVRISAEQLKSLQQRERESKTVRFTFQITTDRTLVGLERGRPNDRGEPAPLRANPLTLDIWNINDPTFKLRGVRLTRTRTGATSFVPWPRFITGHSIEHVPLTLTLEILQLLSSAPDYIEISNDPTIAREVEVRLEYSDGFHNMISREEKFDFALEERERVISVVVHEEPIIVTN